MSRVHRLVLPLVFPEGVHPGAGKTLSNRLILSRDGRARPVLRGTALAGALRHAYEKAGGSSSSDHFGERNIGDDGGRPSRLQVADVVLQVGSDNDVIRSHNGIDRHSGAVRRGSLFDLEALPPGSSGSAVLIYQDESDSGDSVWKLLSTLLGYVANGMTLGGKAARGIGRVGLAGDAIYRCFSLTDLTDHAAWLDEQYEWRGGTIQRSGATLTPSLGDQDHVLYLELSLSIPRGQDLLVADGQGMEHELEPQRVRHADGKEYWRLPGASLRGVVRAWISRLAARDGYTVDDRVGRYVEGLRGDGDAIAWGFDNTEHDPEQVPDCPILSLFGSAARKGRLHISDGLCAALPEHKQVRKHVAVDRITGGANDGFLFDSAVLCGDVTFPIRITVHEPSEREVQWLTRSLKALDLGLIRLGSSKAVGVVNVRVNSARGPHQEAFSELIGKDVAA